MNKALAVAMLPPIESEKELESWRHHLVRAEDAAAVAGQSPDERFKVISSLCFPLMMAYGKTKDLEEHPPEPTDKYDLGV